MTLTNGREAERELSELYRRQQIFESFGLVLAISAVVTVWIGSTITGLLHGLSGLRLPYESPIDVVANPFVVIASSWAAPEQVWGPGWLNGVAYWVTTAAAMTLMIVAYLRMRHQSVRRRRDRLAGLASAEDVQPLAVLGPAPRRMVVGWGPGMQILATEARHSLAVIGATGMGKTFTGVIPIVKEHSGAVIVTTLKSSLLTPTLEARRHWGNVYVFDPLGLVEATLPRIAWSPIAAASTYVKALRIANRLAEAYALLGKGDPFWAREGEDLVAAALYGANRCGHTMADLILRIRGSSFQQWVSALETADDGDMARVLLTETQSLPERQRSSRTVSAIDFVRVYQDPNLSRPTPGAVVIDPAEFAHSTDTLYVVAPLGDQARLAPVLTALIDAFTEPVMAGTAVASGGDRQPNLLLAVEEAANSAVLPNLPELLNTGREQGLTLITVWQSLAQVKARYGDKADEVIDGHRGVVVYGGSKDPVTLHWLQQVAGEGMFLSGSVTAGSHQSWQSSHQHRAVLPAEMARSVSLGGALFVYGTLPPIRLRARTPDQVALPRSPVRRTTTVRQPVAPVPAPPPPPAAAPVDGEPDSPHFVVYDVEELEGDLFDREHDLAESEDDGWLVDLYEDYPSDAPQLTLLDFPAETGGDDTTR